MINLTITIEQCPCGMLTKLKSDSTGTVLEAQLAERVIFGVHEQLKTMRVSERFGTPTTGCKIQVTDLPRRTVG